MEIIIPPGSHLSGNQQAALGADQTIYCPAFPENGRSIFMGNLFVGEQPLAESPMKDHPLTPMRDSNLLRLLAPQVTGTVGLANRLTVAAGATSLRGRLTALKDQGVAHVVVDAVADEDLRIIAEACQDMPLLTGGSAVTMSLPEVWSRAGSMERADAVSAPVVENGPALVLSGSCSAMTVRQVATYLTAGRASFRLDPLVLAESGSAPLLAWLGEQNGAEAPIVYASARPEEVRAAQDKLGTQVAGNIVEAALADCAVRARELGYRRFVVAGGETSGAVTKALGMSQLDIGREVAPGVPWCYGQSGSRQIAIILKSGNFGTESFFADALAAVGA